MRASKSYDSLGLWMLPLALIAAPLFEEFIFRGLIFGGLRRSFGVWPAALASAAIFAIVHPAISIVPVFVLGVCAALVYERSRSLLAPMIVHARVQRLRDRRADIPSLSSRRATAAGIDLGS